MEISVSENSDNSYNLSWKQKHLFPCEQTVVNYFQGTVTPFCIGDPKNAFSDHWTPNPKPGIFDQAEVYQTSSGRRKKQEQHNKQRINGGMSAAWT